MKSLRILAIILICGGFSLSAPRSVLADPPANAPLPSSLPAAHICHPVAKVFGDTVCKEDANIQPTNPAQFPTASSVRQKLLMQQGQANNMAMIKAIVWQKALVHK